MLAKNCPVKKTNPPECLFDSSQAYTYIIYIKKKSNVYIAIKPHTHPPKKKSLLPWPRSIVQEPQWCLRVSWMIWTQRLQRLLPATSDVNHQIQQILLFLFLLSYHRGSVLKVNNQNKIISCNKTHCQRLSAVCASEKFKRLEKWIHKMIKKDIIVKKGDICCIMGVEVSQIS